jgi:asparagine synthase (glutamine-hydrolysing)
MCGIAGIIKKAGQVSEESLKSMCSALEHRGPDGSGTFLSPNNQMGLAHTRLSFLDLGKNGKQPMKNNSGSLLISFNGEIYNYLELKKELEDFYDFKTGTDTEVVLAAFEKWGDEFVSRLKGMFAIAALDLKKKILVLARDRFGIKPLYYAMSPDKIVFGSELKAINASGEVQFEMDYSAFCDFFVYRYIPSPKTIWKEARKLPPANILTLNLLDFSYKINEYWKIPHENKSSSRKDLVHNVNSLLKSSISTHLRSDVAIGSFLSGGYDSSAIAAYSKEMGYNLSTFSIGFEDWPESEDQHAKIVADHLKLKNTNLIAAKESLDLIDLMPEIYDEPIADISIIPTYLVSKLARNSVKGVLSGEGADELFGGYAWQKEFYSLRKHRNFFKVFKKGKDQADSVSFYAKAMAMGRFGVSELAQLISKDLKEFIPSDPDWFYRQNFNPRLSPMKSIQSLDIKCFLGELVLTKIDRASMANSLEVRVPFLDHELFNEVLSSWERKYYDEKKTKYLLFENIKKKIPKKILERKKQGFVGPDSYYMDINWYKNQLKSSKLIESGIINEKYVSTLLKNSDHWRLWKILVMSKWFGRYQ